jgi:tRNA pseudouridine38-40 synthase
VAGESVNVQGSGRTDAGVHALQQVAHFDATAQRTPRQWLLGINSNLPPDVAVRWSQEVSPDFNARRSAVSRRYRYTILQQAARPARAGPRDGWLREPRDCAAMSAATVAWRGEPDISAFRAAGCHAKTPTRRRKAGHGARRPHGYGHLVTCEFSANAFLQHMVRNLAGTLAAVGRGELLPRDAAAILAGRDRSKAGVTAPPAGLALVEVLYPPHYGLPHYREEP